MVLASKKIIWLTRVLDEAGLKTNSEVTLRSNNQAAIGWETAKRCLSGRAKHLTFAFILLENL